MRNTVSSFLGAGLLLVILTAGCPIQSDPSEYIGGQTNFGGNIGDTASVNVVSPATELAIAGGVAVEVNYRAVGTTTAATVQVFFDKDTNPSNGNEIVGFTDVPLSQTSVLMDTSQLDAGSYLVGVVVVELTGVVASDYASGTVIVNQQSRLYFQAPRDTLVYDRSDRISPTIDVAWTVNDPDSTISTEVFLDPDLATSGNEVLLYRSDSQTGDSFSFELRTAIFPPGTYNIVAVVKDSVSTSSYDAPGSIRLRGRQSGVLDLRALEDPSSGELAGAIFEGFNPRDNAGSFVTSLEDTDGDGFDDFMILAQFGKPGYSIDYQRNGVGEGYLVYGRQNRFSGKINLNSTGTLFRGEFFAGVPQQEDPIRPTRGITAFDLMSDWDGDGVRELAFGMPFTDSLSINANISENDDGRYAPLDVNGYFRSGGVVVASGVVLRPDLGFPGRQVIHLAEIGTLAHRERNCEACDPDGCPCPEGFYGPKAPSSFCGESYFHQHWASVGGAPNFGSVRLGCRFSSNDFGDAFGETLSSYDFDGIIMGAPNRDPYVATLTYNTSGQPGELTGSGVVSLYYMNLGFCPWTSVNAPPENADVGYNGMTVGDNNLLPHGGPYHYIVDDFRFASDSPGYYLDPDDSTDPCQQVTDADAPHPHRTFRMWSATPGARLSNVKAIRDFNSDGLQDILLGAPFLNEGRGACFLILGRLRSLVWGNELQVEELQLALRSTQESSERVFDGVHVIGGIGERLGESQDDAGDFNNDGVADVVIGSPLTSDRRGGAAVLFGDRELVNLSSREIAYADIAAKGLGVILVGEEPGDLAGARVRGARDIDGDGYDDLLIAAPNKSVRLDTDNDGVLEIDRTNCGVVYLVYGSAKMKGKTLNLADCGTEQLPGAVFIGRNSGDFLGAGLGEQGDRSFGTAAAGDVDGDGNGDLLLSSIMASPANAVEAGEVYLIYGQGD